MTIETHNALLIGVPKGTCTATIWQDENIAFYDFHYDYISHISLPAGQYEILGLGYDFMGKVSASVQKEIFNAIETNLLNPATTLILLKTEK